MPKTAMRISELAAASGSTAKTIRFYEEVGVLPQPDRARNGYRSYGQDSVDRIKFVRRAQAAGLTLHEIRDVLAIRSAGSEPCGHVQDVLVKRLGQVRAKIAELAVLEEHLEALLDRARRDEPPFAGAGAEVCWIIEGNPR